MGEAIPDELSIEMVCTPEEIQQLSDLFDEVCRARHAMGAEKYGPLDFVSNDVLRMILEELSDVANYARYAFIKASIIGTVLKGLQNPEPRQDGFFNPAVPKEQ